MIEVAGLKTTTLRALLGLSLAYTTTFCLAGASLTARRDVT